MKSPCRILTYNPPRGEFSSTEHAKYYLLGVYLSDGTIAHGQFTLKVRDRKFRDITSKALNLLEIKHSRAKYRRLGGRAIFKTGTSKTGNTFSVYVLSTPEGRALSEWMVKSTRSKEHLPYISSELLPEVLAGVLDGDGSANARLSQVRVTGVREYLPKLVHQLSSLGIKIRGPYSYEKQPNLRRYTICSTQFLCAGLYFRMPRKQKIVDQWVDSRK
jgi:hypothetical protein